MEPALPLNTAVEPGQLSGIETEKGSPRKPESVGEILDREDMGWDTRKLSTTSLAHSEQHVPGLGWN